jgi:hypothetical protein
LAPGRRSWRRRWAGCRHSPGRSYRARRRPRCPCGPRSVVVS